jgi:hypothetical protein
MFVISFIVANVTRYTSAGVKAVVKKCKIIVNSLKRAFFGIDMNRLNILLVAVIMATAVVLSAGALFVTKDDRSRFLEQRAQLVMRDIGHRILLHSGDSTSRVLPVKQIAPANFQISFQSEFNFVPDTLIKVIHARLIAAQLPLNYIVNVFDCVNNQIVYGYERMRTTEEMIQCEGRTQTRGCYIIQITFTDWKGPAGSSNTHYLFALALAGIAGLTFIGSKYIRTPKTQLPVAVANHTVVMVGKYSFDFNRRVLLNGSESVALSEKESRLLQLLAASPNEALSRDFLLKEIWENEGVFVGRSLDVFVSKLRKKLQNDPAVRIISIHGKGYKLEIDR